MNRFGLLVQVKLLLPNKHWKSMPLACLYHLTSMAKEIADNISILYGVQTF